MKAGADRRQRPRRRILGGGRGIPEARAGGGSQRRFQGAASRTKARGTWAPRSFPPELVPGGGRLWVLSRLSTGSTATGAKLRKGRDFADRGPAPRPPRPFFPASGGGGAARWLPWRHAVFVTRGVPARRHRHGEPAAVGSVHLAVATRAAASGEGGGAFQELQLSDREERR